jgi:hypothetical protein
MFPGQPVCHMTLVKRCWLSGLLNQGDTVCDARAGRDIIGADTVCQRVGIKMINLCVDQVLSPWDTGSAVVIGVP